MTYLTKRNQRVNEAIETNLYFKHIQIKNCLIGIAFHSLQTFLKNVLSFPSNEKKSNLYCKTKLYSDELSYVFPTNKHNNKQWTFCKLIHLPQNTYY